MHILHGVDLAVERGEIGVIAGPNGAGKSTLLKAIFGMADIVSGSIRLDGQDIAAIAPERLAALGVAYVPQEYNVFPSLTVQENLEMGAYARRGSIAAVLQRVYGFFPPLADKRRQVAGELSGGQRQMVAVGRALMIEPKILLLDEPTAGLSPMFMSEIFDRVLAVNAAGVTVLMVEQNARQALAIAHRGFILANGENSWTGSGPELLANPDVARSFLGG
jgi:branched-chain amino acid transport system ATP-binding protein